MFNTKNKSEMAQEKPTNGNGTTLIGAGTTLKGDISSNSDLRIDGTVIGSVAASLRTGTMMPYKGFKRGGLFLWIGQ